MTRREVMSARMVVETEAGFVAHLCDGDLAGRYLRSIVTVEQVLESAQNAVEAARDLEGAA